MASQAMTRLLGSARTDGNDVVSAVVGEHRELPPLERILASHALVHTAEGVLYREALMEAAALAGVTGSLAPPALLGTAMHAAWGWDLDDQAAWLSTTGRRAGAPGNRTTSMPPSLRWWRSPDDPETRTLVGSAVASRRREAEPLRPATGACVTMTLPWWP